MLKSIMLFTFINQIMCDNISINIGKMMKDLIENQEMMQRHINKQTSEITKLQYNMYSHGRDIQDNKEMIKASNAVLSNFHKQVIQTSNKLDNLIDILKMMKLDYTNIMNDIIHINEELDLLHDNSAGTRNIVNGLIDDKKYR